MRLVQKKGPFSEGASFTLSGTSDIVHIGIQVPDAQPLSADWKDYIPFAYGETPRTYPDEDVYQGVIGTGNYSVDNPGPDVEVKMGTEGKAQFYVNRAGILEFDVDLGTSVTVTFLKNMAPSTIVDLVYDDQTR